jgi:phospholipid/cholesterol/gamma-HCH transport system substrate-binding protein
MNQRWMRIGIGVFVALSLVLLATLIVLFNSLPRWFKATTVYTVRFTDDVSGLAPGAPVRLSGVKVGAVGDIALDDLTGEVHVHLMLDKPYVVRRDEQVTLVANLLGNDAAIDLVTLPPPEGQAPDRTPVPTDVVLNGVRAGNVSSFISRASEVVPTTQDTLNDIRKSMQRIEKMTPLVEDAFREYRDLGRSLNNSVPDLRRTNEDVDKLAKSLDKLAQSANDAMPALRSDADDLAATARAWQAVGERTNLLIQQNQDKITQAIDRFNQALGQAVSMLSDENIRNVTVTLRNTSKASESFPSISRNADEFLKESGNSLQRFNATMTRMDDLSQNLQRITKPYSDRSETTSRNLDESLAKLNRTLTDLNQMIQTAGQSDGTLNKLLTDPSLYNNLDAVACQAAKAAPLISLILKDVETFTDKLARHPESIGLGGVVRPGSGLKDAPSPSPGLIIPPGHP